MTKDKMRAVGFDPDTKTTGIAAVQFFNGGFQVIQVALVRAKGRLAVDRRREMAVNLIDVIVGLELPYTPTTAAIEWQKLYPGKEKRPNDIVNLNGIAGMCVMASTFLGPEHIFSPVPFDWKKTVPKAIHQKRIVSRLHLNLDLSYITGYGTGSVPGAENIPASMRTHVIDALGLACWSLDPYGPLHDLRIAERTKADLDKARKAVRAKS